MSSTLRHPATLCQSFFYEKFSESSVRSRTDGWTSICTKHFGLICFIRNQCDPFVRAHFPCTWKAPKRCVVHVIGTLVSRICEARTHENGCRHMVISSLVCA